MKSKTQHLNDYKKILIKKNISILLMIVILFTIFGDGKINVKAAAKTFTSSEVANYFNTQVGKTYPSGMCLKFVADSFGNLGAGRSSTCCAFNYGNSHISSQSMDNIPIGADVFFGACGGGPCKTCKSSYYGHIGVYVGDGFFVHATGGKVQKTSLKGTNWKNKYRGWGYHGNVNILSEQQTFRYSIDAAPAEGTTYHNPKDKIEFDGWNLTTYGNGEGVTCTNLCVNGKDVLNCSRYQRDDVANAFPDYPNKNAGFHGSIDASVLSPGKNTISLRAYATNVNRNDILIGDFGHCTIYYVPDSNLQGCIDIAEGGIGNFTVGGWFFDRDTDNPAEMHIYVGGSAGSGAPGYVIKADKERKDVASQYGVGAYHGFSNTISTDRVGDQTLYFYGIDSSGEGNIFLGTRTVHIEQKKSPVGVIDSIRGLTDSFACGGWGLDPNDISKPIWIHIYADGPAGTGKIIDSILANIERPDVAESFATKENRHGFDHEIKTDLSGKHTLYFYCIGIDGHNNSFIGSKTVDIKKGKSPTGASDSIWGGKGCVGIGGWTVDEDDISKSVEIVAYIGGDADSGAPAYHIIANRERTDVGASTGYGNEHGYDEVLTTNQRGEQEVYVYAIDLGSHQPNTLLGHKTVVIEEPDTEEEHIHNYTEEITKPATCEEQGEKQYTCECGDSYTEMIEKLPHTVVKDEGKAATCEEDGLTAGSHCSVCNMVITPQEIVEKLGHKNIIVKYQKDAMCISAGYTGDTYCKNCGIKLKDGEFIPQLEHTMGEGAILKKPTESEAGIEIFTCEVCGTMAIKITPAIGSESLKNDENHEHEYVEEIAKAATYNSPGEMLHVCNCGEYFAETIPATQDETTPELPPETNLPEKENVTAIKLNADTKQLLRGKTFLLQATVLPSNASDQSLTWSSSDANVVTVNADGTIKAINPGTAVVTVSAEDGSGVQAACQIIVPYKITYKMNKGVNHKDNPKSYYAQKVMLKKPTRKGYIFGGWYLDSNFQKKITSIGNGSKEDITLYAKWMKATPTKPSIKKITNSSKKKVKIVIHKTTGAKGYKVLYSTDKKFKKAVKTITTRKTNVTIGQLKKGRKYYIKVCAYMQDSTGNKVYGPYSKIKNIKIKK